MDNHSPSSAYDIRQYGAVGDGKTKDTQAIQSAVDTCANAGGGTVYVPPGKYLTGTIELKSNIVFYIEAGATILGSVDREDYTEIYRGLTPVICGKDAHCVTITGRGTIDGQGAPWWKEFLDWRETNETRPGDPAKEPAKAPMRPKLVRLESCTDVHIMGVRLQNSAAWTVHVLGCEDVVIDGITVFNPPGHPVGPSVNTDGINPESCKNVRISNCHISTGDDNITLKAGIENNNLGPCENITIYNCTTAMGHGGVVIGSEMSGSVRNVTISNCVFNRTYRGIRIKSRRGRGGVVENVLANNIVMDNVPFPFFIDMYYYDFDPGAEKARDNSTPHFKNIRMASITVTGAHKAGHIVGLPEQPVDNVAFSDVTVESKQGFKCKNVNGLAFRNVMLDIKEIPPLLCQNVKALEVKGNFQPTLGEVTDNSGQYQELEIEKKLVED